METIGTPWMWAGFAAFVVIAASVALVTSRTSDVALAAPNLAVSATTPATTRVVAPATSITVAATAENQ